jgi:hypothetical protein
MGRLQPDAARRSTPGYRTIILAHMIRKKLCIERLSEPSCLRFGFEALDFVTDTLVSPAACPFRLRRNWLANIWEAAELEAELCGGEASTADLIAFLRRVDRFVTMAAGICAVVHE